MLGRLQCFMHLQHKKNSGKNVNIQSTFYSWNYFEHKWYHHSGCCIRETILNTSIGVGEKKSIHIRIKIIAYTC